MVKKYIIFLLIAILIFSFGCIPKGEEKVAGAYVGGTEGLEMSFIEGEPPATVLDNNQDPFYITLLLENNGEYTIPHGKVIATLSGISADAFSIESLDTKLEYGLEGRSKSDTEIISGGVEELQFDQAMYKYDLDADFSTELRVDVCYIYQTKGVTKLCLKKDVVKKSEGDQCDITSESVSVENSGAPVQITSVSERSSGTNEVKFTFSVEEKGTGNVYAPDAFTSRCVTDDKKEDYVLIKVSSKADLPVSCTALGGGKEGLVKLIGGKKVISCRVNTANVQETAFEEPFDITLEYFYKEFKTKGITVENSGA